MTAWIQTSDVKEKCGAYQLKHGVSEYKKLKESDLSEMGLEELHEGCRWEKWAVVDSKVSAGLL